MIRRLLAATLVAAAAPVVLQAEPAHAEPHDITGATFTWGLSGYAQKGVFGPWRFPSVSGDATILVGSVSGGTQTEYAAQPGQTSMPASSPQRTPNAVKLVGGTGTADPATGETSLDWTGSYTVNAYPAANKAPDETYADPQLRVGPDGRGTLTMRVTIGAGVDVDGNPSPARSLGRLPVLAFDAGSDAVQGDTVRLTPAYQGVRVEEAPAQVTDCSGTWGSWPAAFVTAMPDAVAPHFYSTSCGGLNLTKAPLPVDVDLGLSGQTTTTTAVSAPSRRYGQSASVTVRVAGATTGSVSLRSGSTELGRATLSGGAATIPLGRPAARSYPLTATYFGSSSATPSAGRGTLTIARATTSTAVALTTRPTRTRAGRATVTVRSSTTTATGRVSLRVRQGSRTVRSLAGTLRAGRVTIAVARLPRGSYTLLATYPTSADVAGSTRAVTLSVR